MKIALKMLSIFLFVGTATGQIVNPGGGGSGSGNTTSTALTTNTLPKANGANSIVNSSVSDDGTKVSTTEPVSAPQIISGTPTSAALAALPAGSHGLACDESSTAGVPATGVDYLRCDSGSHTIKASLNGAAEVSLALSNATTTYNGQTVTLGSSQTGYGNVVARITPLTAQAANVGPTTFFTAPADGDYIMCADITTTQAATASSTQPQLQAAYTSKFTGGAAFNIFVGQNTFNFVGNDASNCVPLHVKSAGTVAYQTQNYASSGATPMQYALAVYLVSENQNGQ